MFDCCVAVQVVRHLASAVRSVSHGDAASPESSAAPLPFAIVVAADPLASQVGPSNA